MATLEVRDGTLVIAVRDGGQQGGPWRPGVGLASMRERAAELGGTLSANDDGDNLVRAVLPLGRPGRGAPSR